MNGAHWHLVVNHVSLFGAVFGLLVLLAALYRDSRDLLFVAVCFFVISGIFGWISTETGELAEDVVRRLPEFDHRRVHLHEEAAQIANILCSITAVMGLATIASLKYRPQWFKPLQWILVGAAVLCIGAMGRTAQLGGLIMHAEIRAEN